MSLTVVKKAKSAAPKRAGIALLILLLLLLLAGLLTTCLGTQNGPTFALYPAPIFGVVVAPNLKVVEVEVDSAAAKAGIQTGDIIESIDNVNVASPQAAMQAARQVQAKQQASLALKRNGQKVVVRVQPGRTSGHGPNAIPGATPTPVPSNYGYF